MSLLKLQNVESSYGPIRAIRGVSLEVARGRIGTVLGANGAGKTTILKTISGILDPRKGSIEFDGADITAQDPADPGVLVLSRFAGAAEQLREALLVNPYDTEGTAAAIHLALQMPLEERRMRYEALMTTIRCYDVHWWCDTFLDALAEACSDETGTSWLRL